MKFWKKETPAVPATRVSVRPNIEIKGARLHVSTSASGFVFITDTTGYSSLTIPPEQLPELITMLTEYARILKECDE